MGSTFEGHNDASNVLAQFDEYKLKTEIEDRCWVHKYNSVDSYSSGIAHGTVTRIPRLEKWRRDKIIGEGGFGVVWLEKEEGGMRRAVKRLSKTKWNKSELQALTRLNEYSQYFVKFLGWFDHEDSIYLSLEYIEHGDLEALLQVKPMTESDAIVITTQLLEGVKIMHENGLCHRDLKPQNILVASQSPLVVKITDFGISKLITDNTALRTEVGTRRYMAPEITGHLNTETVEYTTAVDIWSLGCLIYNIMTKETPFLQESELYNYVHGRIPFPDTKLIENKASNAAIKFISSLMKVDPATRFTAEMALKDPWLNPELLSENSKEPFITEQLGRLRAENTQLRSINTDQNTKIGRLEEEIARLTALTTEQNKLKMENRRLMVLGTENRRLQVEIELLKDHLKSLGEQKKKRFLSFFRRKQKCEISKDPFPPPFPPSSSSASPFSLDTESHHRRSNRSQGYVPDPRPLVRLGHSLLPK